MGNFNFVWENRYVFLFILAVALYAWAEWNNFKQVTYGLMLQAKRYAKDKVLESGDEQVEWVVNKAYQFLPSRLTIFINKDLMRKVIKFLYEKLRDYLDDGLINNSISK